MHTITSTNSGSVEGTCHLPGITARTLWFPHRPRRHKNSGTDTTCTECRLIHKTTEWRSLLLRLHQIRFT